MSLGDIYSQRVVGKKINIPSNIGSMHGGAVFEKDGKTSSLEKSVTDKLKQITNDVLPKPSPQKQSPVPIVDEDPREALKKALEELKKLNAI